MPRLVSALAVSLAATLASAAAFVQTPAAAAAVDAQARQGSFILFTAGDSSTVMNGSTDDLARARRQRRDGETMLYVRDGGQAWIVRDADILRRAAAIFEPQRELGERQGALGEQQAALGERQAALGQQQARLGLRQASVDGRAAADLGQQQAALGRRQDELGRQQDALGQRQSALGRDQERLGRLAADQMRALIADAIRSGRAQRAD